MKFYNLLREYREGFKEENPYLKTNASFPNFRAVIDGQQRLTSIYIGLKGSYAYRNKSARKNRDDETALPTRHLYLNLSSPLDEADDKNEDKLHYNFKFLCAAEIESEPNQEWYKVSDILSYSSRTELDNLIDEKGWSGKDQKNFFPKETIRKLWDSIFKDAKINFFLEKDQELDRVLDIFIRTNKGGKILTPSQLLMSISTAHWKGDARSLMDNLIKNIRNQTGFDISQDLVLKAALVIFSSDIKFKTKNFTQKFISDFEDNWHRFSASVQAAFSMLKAMFFSEDNLKAKNAVVPIIYFIYTTGIENSIGSSKDQKSNRELIKTWITLALLKGLFGGQSDSVLAKTRNVIRKSIDENLKAFPLNNIVEEFKADPVKNFFLTDDYINEEILTKDKDDSESLLILSLLQNYDVIDGQYDKDHLYPANFFKTLNEDKFKAIFGMRPDEELSKDQLENFKFYKDSKKWNSIVNLGLLHKTLNRSKQDQALQDWMTEKGFSNELILLPADIELGEKDFINFYNERQGNLRSRLKNIASIT